ncbi:MAG: exosortase/archaeosortase family protein, partial [Candidatus Hodarchaeota archaeon]
MIRQWWEDSNYSHGFLIPFVSCFLVWRKWDKLAKLDKRPSNLGFLVLILGLLLLILGHLGAEFFTRRFSMLVVVFGLLLLNLGKDHIKILSFPLAFLIFMIPLPYILYDSIAFPLQMLGARAATFSLDVLGIRVLRDGNIIHLSSTSLQVQEACSGIRSLISVVALTTIYSYLTQNGILRRVVLILFAVPIAVIV